MNLHLNVVKGTETSYANSRWLDEEFMVGPRNTSVKVIGVQKNRNPFNAMVRAVVNRKRFFVFLQKCRKRIFP